MITLFSAMNFILGESMKNINLLCFAFLFVKYLSALK